MHILGLEGSEGCRYDSVSVYNGGCDEDPVLLRECGAERTLPPVESVMNLAYVVFSTDTSVVSRGFHLSMIAIDGPPPPPG